MSRTTEIREALRRCLAEVPGEIRVAPGKTSLSNPAEMSRLIVAVVLGPPSAETEAQLDDLLDSLHEAIEADRTLSGTVDNLIVSSHSGYRLYQGEDGKPRLGAEWTVEYLT